MIPRYRIDWAWKENKYKIWDIVEQKFIKKSQLIKGEVAIAETPPLKIAKELLSLGIVLYTVHPSKISEFRDSLKGEKTDENDAKIFISQYYELHPEDFKLYDYEVAETKALVSTYDQLWKTKKSFQNRNSALESEALTKVTNDMEIDMELLLKDISKRLKDNIVFSWSYKQKGIGDSRASYLALDITKASRFATLPKLWKYYGLHVVDGKAPKYKKNVKADFSGERRSHILTLTEGLVGKDRYHQSINSRYKEYYDKRLEKRLKEGRTQFHAENCALRETAKLFLKDLWIECGKLEKNHGTSVNQNHIVNVPPLPTFKQEGDRVAVVNTICLMSPSLPLERGDDIVN
jgi:hypothetical protein